MAPLQQDGTLGREGQVGRSSTSLQSLGTSRSRWSWASGQSPRRLLDAWGASIREANAYVEGRPVRVLVRTKADVQAVEDLVAVKLKPEAR